MLFVVDQRQFGVVYALGQIKEVITEPGLNIKMPPPFQNVRYIDKRLLTLDSTDTEPMLTRSEEHTSELQSQSNLVCRLLLEKKQPARVPPVHGARAPAAG